MPPIFRRDLRHLGFLQVHPVEDAHLRAALVVAPAPRLSSVVDLALLRLGRLAGVLRKFDSSNRVAHAISSKCTDHLLHGDVVAFRDAVKGDERVEDRHVDPLSVMNCVISLSSF